MEPSIPTVTPNRRGNLAVDVARPDETPTLSPVSDTISPGPSTAPSAASGNGGEARAAVPTRTSGLKLVANTGDMVEIGSMLFQEAEAIMRSGQKKRLKVRLGRRTIAEMPLTTGAVGVMIAAMAAVALSRLSVEVE